MVGEDGRRYRGWMVMEKKIKEKKGGLKMVIKLWQVPSIPESDKHIEAL